MWTVVVLSLLMAALGVLPSAERALAAPGPCAAPARAGLQLLPDWSRNVYAYIPRKAAPAGAPKPVVVLLHGSGGNGPEVLNSSRMAATAEKYGFIVVMPSGGIPFPDLTRQDGQEHYAWDVPGFGSPPSGEGDDAFLSRLVSILPQRLCVDPRYTFMSGFSGGARMTSQFGCRHREQVLAIAPVGGLRAGAPVDEDGDGFTAPGECPASGPGRPPLTVIAFHGAADDTNQYAGSPRGSADASRWGYSVPVALSRWAVINGCRTPAGAGPPTEAAVGRTSVRHLYYVGCSGNVVVQLFRFSGGHVWPTPSIGVDINELIIQRFAASKR